MKRKIVFLIVTLVLVVGAYTGYKYLYKDHRDISSEIAVRLISADELQHLFQNNASDELLNKTVVVIGSISEIEENALTLNDKVHCRFDKGFEGAVVGDEIRIKGRCIGYDELFEMVKLDQSSITYP